MTSVILILRSLRFHWRAHLGVVLGAAVGSAALIGAVCITIALWALHGLEETHGKDLDYFESP